jgi:GWxTD domain-containing protein
MTHLEIWVATPAAKALGWTLFYSLFEGAAAALLLAVVLWIARSSRARYAAACVTMLAMLLGFGAAFGIALREQRIEGALRGALRVPPPPDALAGSMRGVQPGRSAAAEILPWLAPFWIAGVLLFHLRSVAGWMATQRLCRTGVCSAPDPWRERLERLRERLRLARPVVLLESGLAGVPVAIGYLRPVILMPAGLLTGLPAGQVEAILLHELAHIRRCDYVINLLQAFVEGLLFYHPATWWISGVIRAEREHCCDDLVVATLGDAHEYASALAALEANRAAPAMATAATSGSLLRRIRRLIGPAERPGAGAAPVVAAVLLTLTAVLALPGWQAPPPAIRKSGRTPRDVQASPWTRWMNEDVAYIIRDDEKRAFQDLQTNEEREHFIEQFWQRRDPTPGTVENEFKEEHYRRIAYANKHFGTDTIPGWKTDRGRIYITYGPPDEIESHPSGGAYTHPAGQGGGTTNTYPFEQWRYRFIQGVGQDIIIDFVDRDHSGAYPMTSDPHGMDAQPEAQRLLPPGPATDANTKSAGATVVAPGDGTASISIPLAAYGEHRLYVYGRLVTGTRRVVQLFEDQPTAAATAVYTRTVRVQPGRYQWFVVVKDVTTGTLYADTVSFEAR